MPLLKIIPNQPLRRFRNYLKDGPWKQKRWFPKRKLTNYLSVCKALRLPADPNALPKNVDPDWRINWKWVLLQSTEEFSGLDIVRYPFYFSRTDSNFGMRTFKPVQSKLFAMRVGDKPINVIVFDADGREYAPGFYSTAMGEKNTLLTIDDIRYIEKNSGHKVTFI